MKVMSSREFNQDVSQAKRAARVEPVFVTDRGKPTHVLMSVEAYRKLTGRNESIVDLLALPAGPELDPAALSAGGAFDREPGEL
ncbi:type II toxin-antitoxin system Phd/YefM family antitoxin [Phenylobacterium deserti]|uniref:Antitoxin n=1 Tax=Phenylobacterium deserti TaxID=1914756 RepID=A0A328AAF4_9CAUL|nr:type II toxin-antitoxin system Phd/YefM family antitoxin [Phenylobacterium deserti]RAK51545.1 type II toxin-antitoxin system Phd/YefM family antitoxin [Phenylobacterium deserti]